MTCYNYVIIIVNQINKLLKCRTHVQLANEHAITRVFMNGFPTTLMNPGIVSFESSVSATIHWNASRVFRSIWIGNNANAFMKLAGDILLACARDHNLCVYHAPYT